MNRDSHLHLLGLTTAMGHQLELVTAQVLARTLMVTESTARLIMPAMGLGAALGVLQTLVARGECGSVSITGLQAWLPSAKAANEARNRVIHSPWVVLEDGTDAVIPKGSMKLQGRTEAELRRDVDLLALAAKGGSDLLRQE
jgi:hypothetical protein